MGWINFKSRRTPTKVGDIHSDVPHDDLTAKAALAWRCAGFALVGFGMPAAFAGVVLLRMVFLPGRGSPMAPFSVDHPAFIAGAGLSFVGLLLLIGGRCCLRVAGRLDRSGDA